MSLFENILSSAYFRDAAVFLACLLLHESGHLLALLAYGEKIRSITCSATGLKIQTDSKWIPYRKEILIYLAGPFFGLMGATVTLFFLRRSFTIPLMHFFFGNLLFSFLNLLPIRGLDGYGALLSFLCLKTHPEHAKDILKPIHFLFLSLLLLLGIELVVKWKNPSLIFLSLLLPEETREKRKKATTES